MNINTLLNPDASMLFNRLMFPASNFPLQVHYALSTSALGAFFLSVVSAVSSLSGPEAFSYYSCFSETISGKMLWCRTKTPQLFTNPLAQALSFWIKYGRGLIFSV
jgi:hypothetical protein